MKTLKGVVFALIVFDKSNLSLQINDIIQETQYRYWKKVLISSHLSPLTLKVVRASQMMLQQYHSTLPCLLLPSGNLQTPFLSIPWCYLPISSSVFLSFLLLSLSPAEIFCLTKDWNVIISKGEKDKIGGKKFIALPSHMVRNAYCLTARKQ